MDFRLEFDDPEVVAPSNSSITAQPNYPFTLLFPQFSQFLLQHPLEPVLHEVNLGDIYAE